MKTIFTVICVVFATAPIFAAPIIPTADGTSWQYIMTEEAGEGLRFFGTNNSVQKFQLPVTYRLSGRQDVDGKALLKFEMHRAGAVTNTDLLAVNERGIFCFARMDQNGELIKLAPPQTMVETPLKPGARWDFNAEVGGVKVQQHFSVIDEEDVDLAAGKFRAVKIHGEQTSPGLITMDRWFVAGTGIVKDVTTTRNADGTLLRRVTLELTERPKVAPRPEVKSPETAKKLTASLGKVAVGAPVTEFFPGTEKIYARWQGNGLRKGAKIRVLWIAENIGGEVPPDYSIDEATTLATAPDSHGVFTLAMPGEGWAPGDYRVEFYVDEALAETVKLKIGKRPPAVF
jgi:hypothetical protein